MTHGTDALLLRTSLPVSGQDVFPDPERSMHINGAFRASLPRTLVNGAAAGATTGRMTMVALSLYSGEVVNGITFVTQSAPIALTHSWVALYDSARNFVGVTADITAAWGDSEARRFEFASPLNIFSGGTYYAGLLRTATNVGTLGSSPTVLSGLMNQEPRLSYIAGTGLTTPNTAPATATIAAAMTAVPFVAVD